MGLHAGKIEGKANGPKQDAMEEGTSKCRVVQVIDLGIQPQRMHEGKPKPPVHQIRLTYEFTDEFCLDEDGNEDETAPRWISEEIPLYGITVDLAKSTKRYKAMDPDMVHGGDFTMMGAAPVNVTVVNNVDKKGKKDDAGNPVVYNNIGAVTSMKKKEVANLPELVRPLVIFSRDDATPEEFAALPTFLQDKIKAGLDFEGCPLDLCMQGEEPQGQKQAQEPAVKAQKGDNDKPW